MTHRATVAIEEPEGVREEEIRRLTAFLENLGAAGEPPSRIEITVESPGAIEFGPEEPSAREPDAGDAPTATDDEGSEPTDGDTEGPSGEPEPTLNPGTRRWALASVLAHTDDALAASEIVDSLDGTDWEMNQSNVSAELYNMFNDGLVDRSGSPYEYELTELGRSTLQERADAESAAIEPDPF